MEKVVIKISSVLLCVFMVDLYLKQNYLQLLSRNGHETRTNGDYPKTYLLYLKIKYSIRSFS